MNGHQGGFYLRMLCSLQRSVQRNTSTRASQSARNVTRQQVKSITGIAQRRKRKILTWQQIMNMRHSVGPSFAKVVVTPMQAKTRSLSISELLPLMRNTTRKILLLLLSRRKEKQLRAVSEDITHTRSTTLLLAITTRCMIATVIVRTRRLRLSMAKKFLTRWSNEGMRR